jgi:pimeloyl-ACP methyl ester carboxylesterase
MEPRIELRVETEDGRTLDVRVQGPEDGTAFVFQHGTPMSAVTFAPFVDLAAERGLRTVTYSRPGYGGSTRHEGRSVADAAGDVAAIADELGADRFLTAGWSGGGPHALATAALLPERVLAAATLAGVGPSDAPDLDFLAGMAPENVEEFGLAMHDHDGLLAFVRRGAADMLEATPEQVADVLGGLAPPVDRAVLTGAFAEFFAESDREAFREGVWGWYDDDLAFVRPWGFDLDGIRMPVDVWQGTLDAMVPAQHGPWLVEHLPTARPHLLDGEGHLSIVIGKFADALDALMDAARA